MKVRILLGIISVLIIHYLVPFIVYGSFSAVMGIKPPEGASPLQFLMSVLVIKIGIAIGFVLIFYFARNSLSGRWLLYACVWWLMFAIVEIGQAIGPAYTWTYAVAGIIAEAIYFPLSAYVVHRLIGQRRDQAAQSQSWVSSSFPPVTSLR